MAGIGIVGAGISGLTLALRLQQLGVETTLYSVDDSSRARAAQHRGAHGPHPGAGTGAGQRALPGPRVPHERRQALDLGPDDLLQGAITPTVRRPVAELPGGRIALAIGDAWIVNDPITGQGANLGSKCAWIAAEAIAAGGPCDTAFAGTTAERMWEAGAPVTDWTNAFLRPAPGHLIDLLVAATTRQDLADLVLSLFSDPAYA